MPKPGPETQQKIKQIEADQRRLKALLGRQENLLKLIEEKSLPDSQPYISFKKGTTILDLKGPPGGIREAFKNDITRIKGELELLRRDATTVRRHGYQELVRRERMAVVRIDRQFEAHMLRVLRNAERRGHLTDEEVSGLQQGADEILDAFTTLLKLDDSEQAIRDVFGQLGDVASLGGGDPDVARRAFDAIGRAAKGHLEKATRALGENPTAKNARKVVRAAGNLESLGDIQGSGVAIKHTVAWLESQRDLAELQFRKIPSSENLKIMFQAETSCEHMGGAPIASPPKGLKRVKSGTEHPIVKGDTLSGISKTYYGTFSYWDVLVRANAQLWANPDKPPTGIISIPF